MKPDLDDLFVAAGVVLAGIGLWLVAPWMSLTFTGVLLITIGLIGSFR